MAHYVPIPKDLNDIKEKFIMGFTKRQVICFGIGLVLGAPVYFLTRASIGMSGAIFAMGAVAAPAFAPLYATEKTEPDLTYPIATVAIGQEREADCMICAENRVKANV